MWTSHDNTDENQRKSFQCLQSSLIFANRHIQCWQILTNPCKSSQIHTDPYKSLKSLQSSEILRDPCKSFAKPLSILTNPYAFLRSLAKFMHTLFHAHTLRVSVGLQIVANPYKSLLIHPNPYRSLQILANHTKSFQICANPYNPCKAVHILANPAEFLTNPY